MPPEGNEFRPRPPGAAAYSAAMRLWIPFVCLIAGLCAASPRDMVKAAGDDQLLASAGVEPANATVRKPCSAAVMETDDPPEFFDCVYVQTAKDVNLFSLEDGHLLSELQVKLNVMDGVALQRMGRWSQVQIFNGDRVAALYIHNDSWIDPVETEAVYRRLLDQGVKQRQPLKWIGP
jgi:hypothetical protein